jgi:ketosteroid isomerase-like protein
LTLSLRETPRWIHDEASTTSGPAGMSISDRLDGRRALVTGAGKGTGAAIAERLREQPSEVAELVAFLVSDRAAAINTYLVAHQAGDIGTVLRCCTDDATVVDEGITYRGPDQIRDWMQRSAGEYTYTIELTDAQQVDDEHYIATHHLEGNFPGGVIDLRFRFTLRDGRISRLTIEP